MALTEGTEVDLGLLGRATVNRLIGQGGQGQVYEVDRPSGTPLALKWYRPQCATEDQYREIQTLVEFGSPHTRFLWPLSIARVPEEPGFGYVMALREDRFLGLSYLLLGKNERGNPLDVSFAAVIAMSRQLSFSFLRLHARGLCYRDISFGNVFFEPTTGDTLICDNDNVGVDDGSGRVLGTPFFMAPEVVRDQTCQTLPSTETDRHSLAVLLFYILCLGHPFEGRRTESGLRDASWLLRNFGTDPLFCMHPERDDNRPSLTVSKYWELYPQFLRDLFLQAFVAGAESPGRRVTEGQWIKGMDRLRDGMVQCTGCRATGFWDPDDPHRVCATCGASLAPDFVVQIKRRKIAVNPFTSIRSDHLVQGVDDSLVIGKFETHPDDQHRWGVQNASGHSWRATYSNGQEYDLKTGRTIEISAGMRVLLNSVIAHVAIP